MMSIGAEGYENCSTTESCLGSDLVVGPMAEDESRTNSLKEAGHESHSHSHIENKNNHHQHHHILAKPTARRGSGLMIELDLLPGGSRSTSTSSRQQPVVAAARSKYRSYVSIRASSNCKRLCGGYKFWE
ncbi:hypothetical protein PanWU01x14_322010 [Parasponia andersonii]|uniref:Uncharacterized protein n=1 Tax=Parasponia andersonii TaxID=3476 RepID=A0A2P5AL03_PARAD|nr:hypothetical protein PanWU01x14_322010 [Parasponia andersonii]